MTEPEKSAFCWAVPKELGIPPDPLRLRLDFHHQATVMTIFMEDETVVKPVDAMDVAYALAGDLSFGTGLLPPDTLWWKNTRRGPMFALYVEPKIRTVTLQRDMSSKPKRFTIPLPGLVFVCMPGIPPWVYSVKSRPTKEKNFVYKAPLANLFADGRSCPGSHQFPTRIADIVESFFISFFSATADLQGRSVKFPRNVIDLWKFLDGKRSFPYKDLVKWGSIADLMSIEPR